MIFNTLLNTLATYSDRISNGTFTHDNFVGLQRVLPDIISAYQAKGITSAEYSALSKTYYILMDKARATKGNA